MNVSKSLVREDFPERVLASEKAGVKGLQNQACYRCGKTWWPRTPSKPKRCPRCKTPYWDRPRREKDQTPKNWEATKKEIQDKLYRKLGIKVLEEQRPDRSLGKALAVLKEMKTDGRTWQEMTERLEQEFGVRLEKDQLKALVR